MPYKFSAAHLSAIELSPADTTITAGDFMSFVVRIVDTFGNKNIVLIVQYHRPNAKPVRKIISWIAGSVHWLRFLSDKLLVGQR